MSSDLVTLLYLAIQIRHSTELARTSNYWQLDSQTDEFAGHMLHDDVLSDIYDPARKSGHPRGS